ncbi:hypothetical protein EVAR_52987_1 [Eumeta japonica]|uniref:Uncharacterized protein n=1 Tax=Eumeta variegata TaxID=151549 RepID=A0A4C1Z6Q4_EUMVA|nr:hypothetical protein EVAR_52987_1 [Eumeta japonica]
MHAEAPFANASDTRRCTKRHLVEELIATKCSRSQHEEFVTAPNNQRLDVASSKRPAIPFLIAISIPASEKEVMCFGTSVSQISVLFVVIPEKYYYESLNRISSVIDKL